MSKRIVKDHKPNFETLKKAFESGNVCLMDCILKSTKEHVAVICAVQPVKGSEDIDTIPFAMFFNGNPYDMLISPATKNIDKHSHIFSANTLSE